MEKGQFYKYNGFGGYCLFTEYHWAKYGDYISTWAIIDGVKETSKNINPETGINAW